jgi:hypothetical protein
MSYANVKPDFFYKEHNFDTLSLAPKYCDRRAPAHWINTKFHRLITEGIEFFDAQLDRTVQAYGAKVLSTGDSVGNRPRAHQRGNRSLRNSWAAWVHLNDFPDADFEAITPSWDFVKSPKVFFSFLFLFFRAR